MGLDQYIREEQIVVYNEFHYMRKHGFMHNYIANYIGVDPSELTWEAHELDEDFFKQAVEDMKQILREHDFEKAMKIMPLPEDGFFFGFYMGDWENPKEYNSFNIDTKEVETITDKDKIRKEIEDDYFACIEDDLQAFKKILDEHDWDDYDNVIVYRASW